MGFMDGAKIDIWQHLLVQWSKSISISSANRKVEIPEFFIEIKNIKQIAEDSKSNGAEEQHEKGVEQLDHIPIYAFIPEVKERNFCFLDYFLIGPSFFHFFLVNSIFFTFPRFCSISIQIIFFSEAFPNCFTAEVILCTHNWKIILISVGPLSVSCSSGQVR